MRQFLVLLVALLLAELHVNSQSYDSGIIRKMNFSQFEPVLHKANDTLYLVNFWATWCAPCREELPAIERVREKYKTCKFKVILVSLDFPKQLNSNLVPFLNTHNIRSEVILLDDADQNSWINKVDPNWSGDIPFTLIYNNRYRQSYSHSFNFHELDSLINLKLK